MEAGAAAASFPDNPSHDLQETQYYGWQRGVANLVPYSPKLKGAWVEIQGEFENRVITEHCISGLWPANCLHQYYMGNLKSHIPGSHPRL